jgi:rRNA-processing protein FCF1
MQEMRETAQRFKALQQEYEDLRQRVGLESLKQVQEDAAKTFVARCVEVGLESLKEVHEEAAKTFVARQLEACKQACKDQDGFFADAVRSHIEMLQSTLR